MGRLWQSLILDRWNPLFADIAVDSLIFEHQAEYYQAIQESTRQTGSVPFIAFMLRMIMDTVTTSAPPSHPPSRRAAGGNRGRDGPRGAAICLEPFGSQILP